MASSSTDQVHGLDFSGRFRGRVVNNVDPKKEGRVGVFIPALITEVPNNLDAPRPSSNGLPPNLFANQDELGLAPQVKRDNYIWARPTHLVETGGGGVFRVPSVGTMVSVYFENGDVNKPYWECASPTVNGDVPAGANIGKGTNLEAGGANWQDPAARTKIHVLAEHDSGNIVYVDSNPNNNAFVIRWANGHTLSIGHAAESGIVLQTEKGHLVQLDENSGEIRLRTQTGQAQIVIADSGDVTITNTGSTTVNTTGATTVNSTGAATIKSAAAVTIQAPKISLKG